MLNAKTQIFVRLKRLAVVVFAVAAVSWLTAINWRLYHPGRVETAIAQLQFLTKSLAAGAAERMQEMFPEGYVFTWVLYGLAWTQVAQALPPADTRRDEALQAAQRAVTQIASDRGKAAFVAAMEPKYGVFYRSWSLYLRSMVLRALPVPTAASFDLEEYRRDCDYLVQALEKNDSPFLPSYPGAVWPVDTVIGVAALAISDLGREPRYQSLIAHWLDKVRRRLDAKSGGIPHAAGLDGFPRYGPRGGSLSLMCIALAAIDPSLARQQYEILRNNFVACCWGIPGVREYPHGVDGHGDIDSGPIVLGFSGPATVVGVGAALANGDDTLATTLLATAEMLGFPLEIAGQRCYLGGLLPVGDAFLAWARTVIPMLPSVDHDYSRIIPDTWRLGIHLGSLLLGAVAIYLSAKVYRANSSNPGHKTNHLTITATERPMQSAYTLVPIDPRETIERLRSWILPGQFRWAIFDRKQRTLFFGPADVHIHLTVAEESGVLSNDPDYYRPGGNILGGFMACSKDGFYYFDPFSGTFPGTNAGVAEAETAMAEICKMLQLPCKRYDDIPKKLRATKSA